MPPPQVALIVFLSHVGCFVPAAAATVGLADRILTRIVSREALAQGRSTFLSDLTQMAGASLAAPPPPAFPLSFSLDRRPAARAPSTRARRSISTPQNPPKTSKT